MVIELRSPPVFEADPKGGWQLVFSVGKPFDRSTPFRDLLAVIAAALGRDGPVQIELPAHKDDEDFVEGRLQFDGQTLDVYFEHALGYLALSGDEKLLKLVAERYWA